MTIAEVLKEAGYDGVYNITMGCACIWDDFSPGNCLEESCCPGIKSACLAEDCASCQEEENIECDGFVNRGSQAWRMGPRHSK